MEDEAKIFDAATHVLYPAINLVEASAGTGKTFAIGMLVLRFVVEHSFTLDQILIVTFTNAATEELGARIRARFVEARDLLTGRRKDVDPPLRSWAENISDKSLALQRVVTALNDIDRAAIFTIHGFCQRILQDQALESGQLFDVELKTDIGKIQFQVVEDFWRRNLYKMTPLLCGVITSAFDSPAKFFRTIMVPMGHDSLIEPEMGSVEEMGDYVEQCYQDMVSWWQVNSKSLEELLQQLVSEGKLKKDFSQNFTNWWQELTHYFCGHLPSPPEKLEFLCRHGFAEVINKIKVRGNKKEELLDGLPLPEEEISGFLSSVNNFILTLRTMLAKTVNIEMEKRMQHENLMSYDDVILRLYDAVKSSQGERLRDLIQKKFRAALIDEFQDTDIEQWQIFKTIFGKATYLYLIGDPKQAIYRFRGADINSYFLAREQARYSLTLEKNYRSHPAMVNEINRLFSSRKNPFYFDTSILGFSPVVPAKTVEDGYLQKNGRSMENMVYCQLAQSSTSKDGRWSSGMASAQILYFVVQECNRLLDGSVVIQEDNGGKRKLQPRDIAILVRTNNHAEDYLECFSRAGIPAVIASKKSVFQTDECLQLYSLLQSLIIPGNIELVKKAMTIDWLGRTGNELYEIWQDEAVFDSWYSKFQSYFESWSSNGFLTMMNNFLHSEKVFQILGEAPLAERKIANIYQLLELIQEAESSNMFGPVQTLRWLEKTMAQQEKEDELRLESDEEAVRIVTMHGAKGLEYPVVFCPFLWYRQTGIEREKHCVTCHENGARVIDLGSAKFEERRERVAKEEFAEDLRLLYVAVTRAKLRCYCIWCDCKKHGSGPVDSFDSPLGYLLFPEGNICFDEQQKRLQSYSNVATVTYIPIKTDEEHEIRFSSERKSHELSLRKLTRSSLYTHWQMTSYSALTSISEHFERENSSAWQKSGGEEMIEFASLPAGANFGSVIHDILEECSFTDLLKPQNHRDRIERSCRKYGIDADPILLDKLLTNVVSIPLELPGQSGGEAVCLADLDDMRCIKEMMFYFHMQKSHTVKINKILAGEGTVAALEEKVVQGYLTGFVDLIFEWNNSFYIVDYKTNLLGENLSDYCGDALVGAMASHNYGLQYWLYSVVLHRHLTNFLPGYQYKQHFGGVLYLFVRGMKRGSDNGTFYDKPDFDTLLSLDRCLGGGV